MPDGKNPWKIARPAATAACLAIALLEGCTPAIITAARSGDLRQVQALVAQGRDVNARKPGNGATALMDAVEGGRADVGWEAEDSLQRGGD